MERISQTVYHFEPSCRKSCEFFQHVQSFVRVEECLFETPFEFLQFPQYEYVSELFAHFPDKAEASYYETHKEIAEVISVALGNLIPVLENDACINSTLHTLTPLMNKFASEMYPATISEHQESNPMDFLSFAKNTLQLNSVCLNSVNICLKHLNQARAMPMVNEPLAAVIFPCVLATYSHFQEWQNTYRKYKAEFQDVMAELYHLSFDIICSILAVINKTNLNSKRTLELVCNGLHSVGANAAMLSAKTFTKTYGNLVNLLENHFTTLSGIDVSPYVLLLTIQAQYFLNKTREVESSVCKIMYKLAGFCIRSLDAICGLFANQFNSKTSNSIMQLAVEVQKFSPSVKSTLHNETESSDLNQCCNLIERLCERLVQHKSFCKTVLRVELSDAFSACMLWAFLLGIQTPHKEAEWLERALFYYDQCYIECSTPYLMKGIVWGGRPSMFEPCSQVLTNKICGYAASLAPFDVPKVVILLLKQLQSRNFFTVVLASDILCFMARYGSSQFCLQLILAVAELLPSPLTSSSLCQKLVWLFGRLCTFLGKASWKAVLNSFCPLRMPVLWVLQPLGRFPPEVCEQLREKAVQKCSEDSPDAVMGTWWLVRMMTGKQVAPEVVMFLENFGSADLNLRSLTPNDNDSCSLFLTALFHGLDDISDFRELFCSREEGLSVLQNLIKNGQGMRQIFLWSLLSCMVHTNANAEDMELEYLALIPHLSELETDPVIRNCLFALAETFSVYWRSLQACEDKRGEFSHVRNATNAPKSLLSKQQLLELQKESMRAELLCANIDKTCGRVNESDAAMEDRSEKELERVVDMLCSYSRKLDSFQSQRVSLDVQSKLRKVSQTLRRFFNEAN